MNQILLKRHFPHKEHTESQADTIRFLWNKIKQYEQRNQKAELKVDRLYQEYEQIVLPHEKKLADIRCLRVKHFMSFLSNKCDLNSKDRESLFEYLESQLHFLYNFPFFCNPETLSSLSEDLDNYAEKYFAKKNQKILDKACNDFKKMLKATLGDDIELPHNEIRDTFRSGNENDLINLIEGIKDAYLEKHPEDKEDWENSERDWADFEFNYYQEGEEQGTKMTEIFRGSELNKIYKRIANVIHPDKETDLAKKAEKHQIMQLLSIAKKKGDVVTLISMYSQYVSDEAYEFDSETLLHINHLLEMRLRELNLTHQDIFNRQGVKSYVWKIFSASSKKKIKEKMSEYIEEIKIEANNVDKEIKKIDSIKRLKKFLRSLPAHDSYCIDSLFF